MKPAIHMGLTENIKILNAKRKLNISNIYVVYDSLKIDK